MYHIEVDAVNREMGIGLHGQFTSEPEWEEIFAESYRRSIAALQRGENVLFDATNYARGVRDHLRKLANQQGASSAVIYVAADADIANQRRQQNQAKEERQKVRDEEFDEVVTGLEVPTEDENVVRYDPSTDIDEWIARTFQ
jgi:predicted kinase